MRKLIVLMVLLGVVALSPAAYATTVFGPKDYVRTTTKAPDIYFDTFSTTPGDARITVFNYGIVTAYISLNGVRILGPNIQSENPYPITLLENNTISVELVEGKRQTHLTVTISKDPEPLSVALDALCEQPIPPGGGCVLNYSSVAADTLRIDPGRMWVEHPSGTVQVFPVETTTYTITAWREWPSGVVTDTATVTVDGNLPPIPTVTLTASQSTINQGESSVLTWSSENADLITIEPDVYSGSDSTGSIEVRPNVTTNYTITGTNASGSDEKTTIVYVMGGPILPSVNISADQTTIQPNGEIALTWTSTNAKICVIEPDIGNVSTSGSTKVMVPETTQFLIIAYSEEGFATDGVIVTAEGPPLPTVSITANSEEIFSLPGKLTWTSTNADSCVIEPGIGNVGPNGTVEVLPAATTTYTITATGPEGTASDSVTLYRNETPPPTAILRADPYAIYRNQSTRLSWQSTNAESPCDLYGNGRHFICPCTYNDVDYPSETLSYTFYASNAGGSASSGVTIVVAEPPPVTITAAPTGIFPNQSSIITWDCPEADSCVIEPGIGPVAPSGSIEVWPTKITKYTITVNGCIGPYSKSVYVSILPPVATLAANPAAIFPGEMSLLTWSVEHADSCEITPGIGMVDFIGSIEVSPVADTTYTLKATNAGGIRYAYADVHIIKPPTVSIWPSSGSIIQPGGSTTVSWRSTDADSVVIEPGIGEVAANGYTPVSPAETTQYTITATGPMGTAVDSCIIGVANPSEIEVFSPAQFSRTGGKANVYVQTFQATPGEGRLIVKNGAEDGGFRITEASILLNGVEIFGTGDFGATVYQLEETVTLAAENTLTVTLKKGDSGGYLTVQAIQDQVPTVDINADRTTIYKGEEATLAWTSTNAYICSIFPSIGYAMPDGTLAVSPAQTTTYAITATGTGGTATDSVTITALDPPPPVVTLSANPLHISGGSVSTLSWNSTGANSCVIEPDIGAVALSGTIDVNPVNNTTYTITATGPGGAATESVSVFVYNNPPTVSLSANPEMVITGNSSTLSWNSTDALSCVMEPGIGPVDSSGTIEIFPPGTTTYTLTAVNPAGSVSDSVAVRVSPLQLSITSPIGVDLISRPYAMVTGTVENPEADEIGVVVNGVIASVCGTRFYANHVPLDYGENTLTVTATDSHGISLSKAITVTADTLAEHIWVRTNSEAGILPFETELEIGGSFNFASPALTHTGGGVEYTENGENRFLVKFLDTGIYCFHVDAQDDDENIYSDEVVIRIYDRSELDTLLQNRWSSMIDNLNTGDTASALVFMHGESQHIFETVFGNMLSRMTEFMSTYDSVTLLSVSGNEAQYKISTVEDGIRYKYPLYFIKDNNGLWKIFSF